ncbi:MAG: hypothetical protein IKM02_05190, partial [Clostridia bacterium]|nr:hypothetical protein [Clostridia bacterium]
MIVFVAHNITSFQSICIYLRERVFSIPHKFSGYIIHQALGFVKDRLTIYNHLSPVLKHKKHGVPALPQVRHAKALTKSTLCQALKNHARQGSKLAVKGAYTGVSDRRLQVQLTQQAKTSLFSESFCVCGVCQQSERR